MTIIKNIYNVLCIVILSSYVACFAAAPTLTILNEEEIIQKINESSIALSAKKASGLLSDTWIAHTPVIAEWYKIVTSNGATFFKHLETIQSIEAHALAKARNEVLSKMPNATIQDTLEFLFNCDDANGYPFRKTVTTLILDTYALTKSSLDESGRNQRAKSIIENTIRTMNGLASKYSSEDQAVLKARFNNIRDEFPLIKLQNLPIRATNKALAILGTAVGSLVAGWYLQQNGGTTVHKEKQQLSLTVPAVNPVNPVNPAITNTPEPSQGKFKPKQVEEQPATLQPVNPNNVTLTEALLATKEVVQPVITKDIQRLAPAASTTWSIAKSATTTTASAITDPGTTGEALLQSSIQKGKEVLAATTQAGITPITFYNTPSSEPNILTSAPLPLNPSPLVFTTKVLSKVSNALKEARENSTDLEKEGQDQLAAIIAPATNLLSTLPAALPLPNPIRPDIINSEVAANIISNSPLTSQAGILGAHYIDQQLPEETRDALSYQIIKNSTTGYLLGGQDGALAAAALTGGAKIYDQLSEENKAHMNSFVAGCIDQMTQAVPHIPKEYFVQHKEQLIALSSYFMFQWIVNPGLASNFIPEVLPYQSFLTALALTGLQALNYEDIRAIAKNFMSKSKIKKLIQLNHIYTKWLTPALRGVYELARIPLTTTYYTASYATQAASMAFNATILPFTNEYANITGPVATIGSGIAILSSETLQAISTATLKGSWYLAKKAGSTAYHYTPMIYDYVRHPISTATNAFAATINATALAWNSTKSWYNWAHQYLTDPRAIFGKEILKATTEYFALPNYADLE